MQERHRQRVLPTVGRAPEAITVSRRRPDSKIQIPLFGNVPGELQAAGYIPARRFRVIRIGKLAPKAHSSHVTRDADPWPYRHVLRHLKPWARRDRASKIPGRRSESIGCLATDGA